MRIRKTLQNAAVVKDVLYLPLPLLPIGTSMSAERPGLPGGIYRTLWSGSLNPFHQNLLQNTPDINALHEMQRFPSHGSL